MTFDGMRYTYGKNADALTRDGNHDKAVTYRRLAAATDDELRTHLVTVAREMRARLATLRRKE